MKFKLLLFAHLSGLVSSLCAQERSTDKALHPPGDLVMSNKAYTRYIMWSDNDTTISEVYMEIKAKHDKGNPKRYRLNSKPTRNYMTYYWRTHSLEVKNLTPHTRYTYRVGTQDNWSDWQEFQTAYPEEAFPPSPIPDRIALTWKDDPATSFAVTWRTDSTIKDCVGQVAIAAAAPSDGKNDQPRLEMPDPKQVKAITEKLILGDGLTTTHHHSVHFTGLKPNTKYAYRVGNGKIWSEWFHYTTANDQPEKFSFIYFGDAQNNLKSMWSRTIREAYQDLPEADFILHAGDLVNIPTADHEWGEWLYAGSFIHATHPIIATPGNHEYSEDSTGKYVITPHWRKHFTFPENGPQGSGLKECAYYVDYQGARIISLNSMEIESLSDSTSYITQLQWLEKVLAHNPNRWTIITFHFPVYGSARTDNPYLKKYFKPLFDKYQVDLVLQGHDHAYGRGTAQNLTAGAKKRDANSGTMYVVSVSGPKMYPIREDADWMERTAEGIQLYQIIHVDEDILEYRAYDTIGELYDGFDLVKQKNGKPNKVIDRIPDRPEYRPQKEADEVSN